MRIVRAIHRLHYSEHEKRFKSIAFEASDDGGVSVFDANCAERESGSICAHLQKHYVPIDIASDPPIYWEFDQDILPPGCVVERTPTEDPCHHDIRLNKKKSKKFFKDQTKEKGLEPFMICDNSGLRPLSEQDVTDPPGAPATV